MVVVAQQRARSVVGGAGNRKRQVCVEPANAVVIAIVIVANLRAIALRGARALVMLLLEQANKQAATIK